MEEPAQIQDTDTENTAAEVPLTDPVKSEVPDSDLPTENQPATSTPPITIAPTTTLQASVPVQAPVPQSPIQPSIPAQIATQAAAISTIQSVTVAQTPAPVPQAQAQAAPAVQTPVQVVNEHPPQHPQTQLPQQVQAPPPPPVRTEWDEIRAKLQENPYKAEYWIRFRDLAEDTGDLEKIKEAYEAILERYPNNWTVQIAYLNHFLMSPASLFCESLFARFLRTSPSVELWKIYIHYVRRIKSGPEMRDTIRKAYEFALSHVGQDKDSGEIWMEYIQFLKSGEANNTWEEQQKMDALRKVYHRAVQIPLENVEVIWRELDAFENGLNKITAKKFLADLNPSYMTAKSSLRELRKHISALFPSHNHSQHQHQHPSSSSSSSSSSRATLYLPTKPVFSAAERAQVSAWRAYLKWEDGNPMVIDDKAVLFARMQGIYRKAVVRMRYFSQIWFLAYAWTKGQGREEEAVGILKAGVEANPNSYLLNMALAEVYENAGDGAAAHAQYEGFIAILREELEALEKEIGVAVGDSNSNVNANEGAGAGTGTNQQQQELNFNNEPHMTGNTNGHGGAGTIPKVEVTSPNANANAIPSAQMSLLNERKQEFGVTYIMYMRFALRHEGVEASRIAFSKARKEKWTPWIVFEAAAKMEYHSAKQLGVAMRIFGVAHTKFPDDLEFVLRYFDFLISVNDVNNAQALFERAISNFPAEKARKLWERWSFYEHTYGKLDSSLKLEKRMAEAYPTDSALKNFALRYSYPNVMVEVGKFDCVAGRDLGYGLRQDPSSSSQGSTSSNGSGNGNGGGGGLSRTETLTSIPSGSSALNLSSSSNKRPSSPERPRRDDPHGPPHKRSRPISPPPRDRERERWEGPPKGRRYAGGSPPWERERSRDRSPPGARRASKDREEHSLPKPSIPAVITRFVGMLPASTAFDGPVFRTDDLMQLFRNAIIPASSGIRPRSPLGPPLGPPRATRPPPDYSPYQGPGGPSIPRGGRRY